MKVNAPIVVDDYCEKKVGHARLKNILMPTTGLPSEHRANRDPELRDHGHEDLRRRSS